MGFLLLLVFVEGSVKLFEATIDREGGISSELMHNTAALNPAWSLRPVSTDSAFVAATFLINDSRDDEEFGCTLLEGLRLEIWNFSNADPREFSRLRCQGPINEFDLFPLSNRH